MKAAGPVTIRLIISFLLVAVAASAVSGEKEVVLDFKGNPVKANTPYRVGRRGTLGGLLYPYSLQSEECSEGVSMNTFMKPNIPNPVSVVFVSLSDNVRVSTQLNIKFKTPPKPSAPGSPEHYCIDESMFWRVGQKNSRNEGLLLLGGSKSSNDSTFTIEKSNNNLYKFAFAGADIGLDKENFGTRPMRLLRDSDDLGEFAFFPATMM